MQAAFARALGESRRPPSPQAAKSAVALRAEPTALKDGYDSHTSPQPGLESTVRSCDPRGNRLIRQANDQRRRDAVATGHIQHLAKPCASCMKTSFVVAAAIHPQPPSRTTILAGQAGY